MIIPVPLESHTQTTETDKTKVISYCYYTAYRIQKEEYAIHKEKGWNDDDELVPSAAGQLNVGF